MGGARSSQTDLWALARTAGGLVSIAVEGKVSESFGPSIGDWEKEASSGKRARWEALCSLLEVNRDCDRDVRYQLFHRTAGALIEANAFTPKPPPSSSTRSARRGNRLGTFNGSSD